MANVKYVCCITFSLEEQVLTRFEEENGGQVVVATVCLLETSRHGLLETELLQMLAEESTLTPPPYVEGESDQITTTEATTTDSGELKSFVSLQAPHTKYSSCRSKIRSIIEPLHVDDGGIYVNNFIISLVLFWYYDPSPYLKHSKTEVMPRIELKQSILRIFPKGEGCHSVSN